MQNLRNLYNQALTAIGHAPNVTNPEANDKATTIVNLWFPVASENVLGAHHWASVRKVDRLARLKTREETLWQVTDPEPGYAYAHLLPADCLRPQFLADYSRFKLGRMGENLVLYSNVEHPILHYTKKCRKPELWSSDLYLAVVYSLAASINIAHNGKLQLSKAMEQRVFELVELASTAEANADEEYFDSVPSHWAGAGFSVPSGHTRFFYPTQTFRVGGIA